MAEQCCVVIGAGLAGGNAAIAARENGFTGQVILVGEESDPPYNRPPLSKGYLRGEENFEDAQSRPQADYDQHEVELRARTRASASPRRR